jgi:hypothetical protein
MRTRIYIYENFSVQREGYESFCIKRHSYENVCVQLYIYETFYVQRDGYESFCIKYTVMRISAYSDTLSTVYLPPT